MRAFVVLITAISAISVVIYAVKIKRMDKLKGSDWFSFFFQIFIALWGLYLLKWHLLG